jgi:hypothetical protein
VGESRAKKRPLTGSPISRHMQMIFAQFKRAFRANDQTKAIVKIRDRTDFLIYKRVLQSAKMF